MSDNRNKDANDCNRCIVVVGGGVAGSSCVQVLADRLPDRSILLINPSRFLKVTANVRRLALNLEQFDVHRVQGERHVSRWSNVRLMADRVVEHDPIRRIVRLQNEAPITYDRLVIATGARPKRWSKIDLSIRDFVVTLRDEKSVQQLQQKLASCRTVLLLGNGGIATELAHAMRNVRTVWLVRDATINTTFLDATTARFFELKTGLKRSRRNESDADQSGSERDGKWHPMHRPGSKHDADENNDGDSDQSSSDSDSNENCSDSEMEPNADDDEEDNEETDDEYNESDDWPDAALGPDWKSDLNLVGCLSSTDYERLSLIERLQFIRNGRLTDIRSMINSNYPIQVQVNDDQWLEVDLVICAIGVRPNLRAFSNRLLLQAPDGGAWVDDQMRTSLRYVYAAGDCATVLHTDRHSKVRRNTLKESLQRLFNETEIDRSMLNESLPARAVRSKRWQQMRLWSQALQTGRYAGHSVACDLIGESPSLYACFDMFAHVTRFFDTKVVLLGRHRTAQLSEPNRKTEIWIRVQENRYLIKLIMQRNRLQGAVLIGDTDLEETIENLLYSQLNLRHLKSKMLLDNYDLEDFFD